MDSLLAVSNGNTCEFTEESSQGTSQPRMKEEAGRLQRRLRNLKGLLTKDATSTVDKIRHLKKNIWTTEQRLHLCRLTMPKTYLIT